MPRKAPFRERMEEFEAKLRNRSKNTRRTYSKILQGFWKTTQELGYTKSPTFWTEDMITDFIEARATTSFGLPRANSSIRNEISLLNKFLRFCNNYHLHKALEFGDVRLPPNTKYHRRWKSLEEIICLRVQARELGDAKALITLMIALDVYLRIGEIITLELSDLTGPTVIVRQGKGRKDREVSITERTRMDLEEYISGPRAKMLKGKSCPFLLFYMSKGDPIPYKCTDTLAARIRRLGRSCDPPIEVSPHDLRRSGAQLTYISNPTDKTVRDLQGSLGHSNTEQTRQYIGAGVVDQYATLKARDRYFAKMYPKEFGQGQTHG